MYTPAHQIEWHSNTQGTKGKDIQDGLRAIKSKCERLNVPYPCCFWVDDCCKMRKTIEEVFPNSVTRQDIKHIINRIVEQLSKKSACYGDACRKLHSVVVGGEMSVIDRTGQLRAVPQLLDHRDIIIGRLREWEAQYKRLDPSLFLSDFTTTFKNQLHHFALGCVDDVTIAQGQSAPRHFLEMTDGKFVLLRGTNRDESLHRRMNGVWPDWCGEELAEAIKTAFFFNWTAYRVSRPCSLDTGRDYIINFNPSPQPVSSATFLLRSGADSSSTDAAEGVTDTVVDPSAISTVGTVVTHSQRELSDAELETVDIDALLNQRRLQSCATVDTLLKAGCNIGLTNVRQVQLLLRYKRPGGPLRVTTASGNLLGTAPPVRTGIDKRYERMDTIPGSKKASLTPARRPPRKRKLLTADVPPVSETATAPQPPVTSLKGWTDATTSILTLIAGSIKGTIKWDAVEREFNSRSEEKATSIQLKSRWQQVKKTKTNLARFHDDGTEYCTQMSASVSEHISGRSSNVMILPLPLSNASSTEDSRSRHPLRDYTYTLAEINAVSLELAPKGEEFTAAEQEILDYIIAVKLGVKPGGRVEWKNVHEFWKTTARVQKLNKPHAKIYLRTKDQLEERWKTIRKKAQKI
jgi:hypothetical protein